VPPFNVCLYRLNVLEMLWRDEERAYGAREAQEPLAAVPPVGQVVQLRLARMPEELEASNGGKR